MAKYCIGVNIIGLKEYVEHFQPIENNVYKRYNQRVYQVSNLRFKNFNNKYK